MASADAKRLLKSAQPISALAERACRLPFCQRQTLLLVVPCGSTPSRSVFVCCRVERLEQLAVFPALPAAMPPAHLKGALVDKYAEIALFDAAENQRVILEGQQAEQKKKAEMKAALDAQMRMQQEALLRERQEDLEWVKKEQERIKIWNAEEKAKIQAQKGKDEKIKLQREQQLRELAALRDRERKEMQDYDMGILRSIHKEIKQERAKEVHRVGRR